MSEIELQVSSNNSQISQQVLIEGGPVSGPRGSSVVKTVTKTFVRRSPSLFVSCAVPLGGTGVRGLSGKKTVRLFLLQKNRQSPEPVAVSRF
jgi:hypothetical protein